MSVVFPIQIIMTTRHAPPISKTLRKVTLSGHTAHLQPPSEPPSGRQGLVEEQWSPRACIVPLKNPAIGSDWAVWNWRTLIFPETKTQKTHRHWISMFLIRGASVARGSPIDGWTAGGFGLWHHSPPPPPPLSVRWHLLQGPVGHVVLGWSAQVGACQAVHGCSPFYKTHPPSLNIA